MNIDQLIKSLEEMRDERSHQINTYHINTILRRLDKLGDITDTICCKIRELRDSYLIRDILDTEHNILRRWKRTLEPHFEKIYYYSRKMNKLSENGPNAFEEIVKKIEEDLFTTELVTIREDNEYVTLDMAIKIITELKHSVYNIDSRR